MAEVSTIPENKRQLHMGYLLFKQAYQLNGRERFLVGQDCIRILKYLVQCERGQIYQRHSTLQNQTTFFIQGELLGEWIIQKHRFTQGKETEFKFNNQCLFVQCVNVKKRGGEKGKAFSSFIKEFSILSDQLIPSRLPLAH